MSRNLLLKTTAAAVCLSTLFLGGCKVYSYDLYGYPVHARHHYNRHVVVEHHYTRRPGRDIHTHVKPKRRPKTVRTVVKHKRPKHSKVIKTTIEKQVG